MFCTFSLQNVLFATVACNFSTSELQKVLQDPQFFNILTWECAFRHSGVQFFDIRTSKSAPRMTVFLIFWLDNVLFATAACNFSTSELQKVLRDRQFFSIFTSKCAFRHNCVQFFISPLSTYLRTRRFNRPTFRLTRHTNHWKNRAFRDFSNIWRGCIFFLLTFALLHLLSADLTTLLCFSTVHIVGSLLFKLPSINGVCWGCYYLLILTFDPNKPDSTSVRPKVLHGDQRHLPLPHKAFWWTPVRTGALSCVWIWYEKTTHTIWKAMRKVCTPEKSNIDIMDTTNVHILKESTSSKPSFWVSMLVFGDVPFPQK